MNLQRVVRRGGPGPALLLLIAVASVVYIGAGYDSGQDTRSIDPGADADGPYVIWISDSCAVVLYLCGDNLVLDTLCATSGGLRFAGRCADTGRTYRLRSEHVPPPAVDSAGALLAVSDIHGEYRALVRCLQQAGVIDLHLGWTWGTGRLVINGDVFDRGPHVTECLWLIYRLEEEALQAGGRVHFLLGNHELMVMRGDLRYVHDRYLQGIARRSRVTYTDLFGPDSELGRWLRTRNSVVRIDDLLFVHGGMPPWLVDEGLGIDEINRTARTRIDLRSSQLAFLPLPRRLYGSEGPFWYRGYHYALEDRYAQASEAEIERILEYYGVRKAAVGHTEVDSLTALYDGRIIAIDIPLEDRGGFEALLRTGDDLYRIRADGSRVSFGPPTGK